MQEIYNDIVRLSCQLNHVLNDAMVLCHSWGYNGFKRLYRYSHKKMSCYIVGIQNEMRDEQHLTAPQLVAYKAYIPLDIKDHSKRWLATLKDACVQLSELSTKLRDMSGKQSRHVKKMLCMVYELKEKAQRFLDRAEEVSWMPHDLHMYDDRLHDTIKKKERKHGHK